MARSNQGMIVYLCMEEIHVNPVSFWKMALLLINFIKSRFGKVEVNMSNFRTRINQPVKIYIL